MVCACSQLNDPLFTGHPISVGVLAYAEVLIGIVGINDLLGALGLIQGVITDVADGVHTQAKLAVLIGAPGPHRAVGHKGSGEVSPGYHHGGGYHRGILLGILRGKAALLGVEHIQDLFPVGVAELYFQTLDYLAEPIGDGHYGGAVALLGLH